MNTITQVKKLQLKIKKIIKEIEKISKKKLSDGKSK